MYGALPLLMLQAQSSGGAECPGSAKPHPSLRPGGSLYRHESLSGYTRVNLRMPPSPPTPTTCAQIPGTLSIKDAEQISFTLIRTRKICERGGQRCVVAAHVVYLSLGEPAGLRLGLLDLEERPSQASAGVRTPRGEAIQS